MNRRAGRVLHVRGMREVHLGLQMCLLDLVLLIVIERKNNVQVFPGIHLSLLLEWIQILILINY